MTDFLRWRAKFELLAPSNNMIFDPAFYRLSVPGMTSHFSRIYIRD